MVICVRNGKYEVCKGCTHADPHESEEVNGETCTMWGECWADEAFPIKVRCTAVVGE